MAVHLRLARFGGKAEPFYRIVAAHHKNSRNGRCLEVLGSYNPKKGFKEAKVKMERVVYWKGKGALPTQAVSQILKSLKPNSGEA